MASTAAPSAPFLSPRPIHRDGGQRGGLGDPDELEGEVAIGALAVGILRTVVPGARSAPRSR